MAQLSEFEVQGPTSGDTQAPAAPSNLALTQPQAGQIRLTWNASTDNVGVTGYDVYANGSLRTTVTGTNHTDSQPDGLRVTYHVIAKDAAGEPVPRQQHRDARRRHRNEPGAGQARHGEQQRAQLRRRQRQRLEPGHLLGVQRVPRHADRPTGIERGRRLGRGQAQPRLGLGRPHAERRGPRPRAERHRLHQPRRLPRLPLRPGDRQRRHDQRGRQGRRPPAARHVQHRCARRPGGGDPGVRHPCPESRSHRHRDVVHAA